MNGKMKRYLLCLALAVSSMVAIRYSLMTRGEGDVALVPQPRDFAEIQQEGILRIATDYTPLNFYQSGDSVIGFDYELAQLISQRSGLEVQLFPEVELERTLAGLESNQFDVVARPLPMTSYNKEHYLLTRPIHRSKLVLVQVPQKGEQPLRNQLDLAQKRVRIAQDEATKQRVENLAREIGDTIFIEEEALYGVEQLVILVAKGEIPYTVCDQAIAKRMKEEFPQLDIATDIGFAQFQSWAVREASPELCDSLNLWLSEIQATPYYKERYRHYFGGK